MLRGIGWIFGELVLEQQFAEPVRRKDDFLNAVELHRLFLVLRIDEIPERAAPHLDAVVALGILFQIQDFWISRRAVMHDILSEVEVEADGGRHVRFIVSIREFHEHVVDAVHDFRK